MTSDVAGVVLRMLELDETLAKGRDLVDVGALSEAKFAAISDAIRDFQDAAVGRIAGSVSSEELRAHADVVLELMRP